MKQKGKISDSPTPSGSRDNSIVRFFRDHFGPGILWALMGIGSMLVILVLFSAALMALFQIFFFIANCYIVRTQIPASLQPAPAVRILNEGSMLLVFVFGLMGAVSKLGLFDF